MRWEQKVSVASSVYSDSGGPCSFILAPMTAPTSGTSGLPYAQVLDFPLQQREQARSLTLCASAAELFTRATGSGDSPNLTDGVALAYASPCFRLVHPLKPVARSDRQRSEKEAEEGMQILRQRQKVMD